MKYNLSKMARRIKLNYQESLLSSFIAEDLYKNTHAIIYYFLFMQAILF